MRDVLLFEQESIPGFHSSGRNAAMMRQCVPDPDLATLTRDGATFLRHLPDDWPEPVQFKQNGSLLLGQRRRLGASLNTTPKSAGSSAFERRYCGRRNKRNNMCRCSKQAEFDGAVWCASDGIVDIHALLSGI